MDDAGLERHTVQHWLVVMPLSLLCGWVFSLWGAPVS